MGIKKSAGRDWEVGGTIFLHKAFPQLCGRLIGFLPFSTRLGSSKCQNSARQGTAHIFIGAADAASKGGGHAGGWPRFGATPKAGQKTSPPWGGLIYLIPRP